MFFFSFFIYNFFNFRLTEFVAPEFALRKNPLIRYLEVDAPSVGAVLQEKTLMIK